MEIPGGVRDGVDQAHTEEAETEEVLWHADHKLLHTAGYQSPWPYTPHLNSDLANNERSSGGFFSNMKHAEFVIFLMFSQSKIKI